MRCRVGVDESAVGKARRIVDSTEHPQCEGVAKLRYDAGILAKPIGEIAMPHRVKELHRLLKMLMGSGKIAKIEAGGAESAVSHQDFGAIRPSCGLAQEQLRQLAHRLGFAAREMPHPKTKIGGEPFRGIFHLVRQFAGARKGGAGFRRLISLGPDQRVAEARLQV
jgi:hypothetical protein